MLALKKSDWKPSCLAKQEIFLELVEFRQLEKETPAAGERHVDDPDL